ncbi:MAG: hypothetical protein Q9M91_08465 [Candidatus Dojkabacteria bacterium]|nr:hypothetical protein [Candidatus Dojkabacteria bacterium]MDQ7021805.1 hypothetical protein [Candidatus Dojkabacteria bacterium]
MDEIHRVFLAKLLGRNIKCLYAKHNEQPEVPVIAYPVSWEEVEVRIERPTDPAQIRRMRIANASTHIRAHYRDLRFLGSKGRRPLNSQEG